LPRTGISLAHAHDLLTAFERDCTIDRYEDWAGLIDYCRYSAMPVGRFVLDCHGEDRALWPMNDALCAALQVINHLQDCAKDYRTINRVYIPLDSLRAAGIGVEALGEPRSNPALRDIITDLTLRTRAFARQRALCQGDPRLAAGHRSRRDPPPCRGFVRSAAGPRSFERKGPPHQAARPDPCASCCIAAGGAADPAGLRL
jgi:hypothetical protein